MTADEKPKSAEKSAEKEPDPEKYPACRYHATEDARIVHNEEEDKKLGAGWVDNPDKLKKKDDEDKPEHKTPPPAPTRK